MTEREAFLSSYNKDKFQRERDWDIYQLRKDNMTYVDIGNIYSISNGRARQVFLNVQAHIREVLKNEGT